ncbi:hypothetical protein [Vibrio paucivorans]
MNKLLPVLSLSFLVALSAAFANEPETNSNMEIRSEALKDSEAALEATTQINQRVSELQIQLSHIKKQAFEQNPQLVQETDEANKKLDIVAKEIGYDPQGFEQELSNARNELADENITEEKRQEIYRDLQQEQIEQTEKRAEFLQTPEVLQTQQDLQFKVFEEMKKIEPKTEELIQELQMLLNSMDS